MTLKQVQNTFLTELKGIFPPEEIKSFFYVLTEYFLNLDRLHIALEPHREIDEKTSSSFLKALEKLKTAYPVQYITGETEFYGLSLKVNENVLIPRPETEELISWIIESFEKKKSASLLDIGTGSGCIAIALAKELPKTEVKAIDVSEQALDLAKTNAKTHQLDISFLCQDILMTKQLAQKYDVIVSNPPYVRESEKKQMHDNVLKHEPDLALFVTDQDPLIFYKKISTLALESLHSNGLLFFEINQYLAEELLEHLETLGFKNVQIKKDLYGADRMIRATKI